MTDPPTIQPVTHRELRWTHTAAGRRRRDLENATRLRTAGYRVLLRGDEPRLPCRPLSGRQMALRFHADAPAFAELPLTGPRATGRPWARVRVLQATHAIAYVEILADDGAEQLDGTRLHLDRQAVYATPAELEYFMRAICPSAAA